MIARSSVLSTSQHIYFLSKTSGMQRGTVPRLKGLQSHLFSRTPEGLGFCRFFDPQVQGAEESSARALHPDLHHDLSIDVVWG